MAIELIIFFAMLVCSSLLDGAVRPRGPGGREWTGRILQLVIVTGWFGGVLAIFGSVPVAAALTLAWMAVLKIASNSKYPVLGEPLVFSDVVLIAAVARHPRFYFTAVSLWQRCMLVVAAAGAAFALAALFVASVTAHLLGAALLLGAAAAVLLMLRTRSGAQLAAVPDAEADVARLGLVTTLVLYWLRWRRAPDPPPCPAPAANGRIDHDRPELIVIVQCESFADPVALTGQAEHSVPGLTAARAAAWRWGNLDVSGFGAYTMRTEYGVLFGRGEQALGFRRYDPFLTARRETSYALPMRLRGLGYRALFVHPHDMRFYGRDRLMPAIGFDRLIGEDDFAPAPPGERYVPDKTLGASLGDLIDQAAGPTLIYAVTMANHGPWANDPVSGRGGLEGYLHHLRNSDAMLADLRDRLSAAGRTALLVFFGDHRPSIPGVSEPGGARDTPYVMLRFAADGTTIGGLQAPAELAPDQLHHAILRALHAGPADGPAAGEATAALDHAGAIARDADVPTPAPVESARA